MTSRAGRCLSPAADRDLVLMGLFCAVLVALAGAGAVLVAGLVVATVLAGGPLAWPPPEAWATTAATIPAAGVTSRRRGSSTEAAHDVDPHEHRGTPRTGGSCRRRPR